MAVLSLSYIFMVLWLRIECEVICFFVVLGLSRILKVLSNRAVVDDTTSICLLSLLLMKLNCSALF